MKKYLIDTFSYNDWANRKLLEKISQLPDKHECVRYLSHLINSMNKWMARILHYENVLSMDWWEPQYPLDELESRWSECLKRWILFLESKTEDEIAAVVRYVGDDGGLREAKLQDIALQLNYHSIHHRAQMQTIIRKQGLEPDFLDYIGTVYKHVT